MAFHLLLLLAAMAWPPITSATSFYMFGGQVRSTSTFISSVDRYDFSLSTWSSAWSPIPGVTETFEARQNCAAAVNGKIYVVGGQNAVTMLSHLSIFEPLTGTFSLGTAMPSARRGHACVSLRGKLVVLGGYDNTNYLNTVIQYNPGATTAWTSLAPMLIPKFCLTAEVYFGRIYVVGGASTSSGGSMDVQVYDAMSNAWSILTSLPFYSMSSASGILDGLLYHFGGTNWFNFNPKTGSWDPLTSVFSQSPTWEIRENPVVANRWYFFDDGNLGYDWSSQTTSTVPGSPNGPRNSFSGAVVGLALMTSPSSSVDTPDLFLGQRRMWLTHYLPSNTNTNTLTFSLANQELISVNPNPVSVSYRVDYDAAVPLADAGWIALNSWSSSFSISGVSHLRPAVLDLKVEKTAGTYVEYTITIVGSEYSTLLACSSPTCLASAQAADLLLRWPSEPTRVFQFYSNTQYLTFRTVQAGASATLLAQYSSSLLSVVGPKAVPNAGTPISQPVRYVVVQPNGVALPDENTFVGLNVTIGPLSNASASTLKVYLGAGAPFIYTLQPAPASGSSFGDPVVQGFDGSRFEFNGLAGRTYTWYSDVDISVLVELAQPDPGHGIYISAISLLFGHKGQLNLRKFPNSDLNISPVTKRHKDGSVSIGHCGWARVVSASRAWTFRFRWHQYDFSFMARRFVDQAGQVLFHYLNLELKLKDGLPSSPQVDGVLGQTLRPEESVRSVNPSDFEYSDSDHVARRSVFKRSEGKWSPEQCANEFRV